MEVVAVVLLIAGMIYWGRFNLKLDSVRWPIGPPVQLFNDRERLIEIRTTGRRVAEGIRHSMEAGCVVDNVEAGVERLLELESEIKRDHDVRNALGTFRTTVMYAIAKVGSASETIETQECQILLAQHHQRLQDAIDRALAQSLRRFP